MKKTTAIYALVILAILMIFDYLLYKVGQQELKSTNNSPSMVESDNSSAVTADQEESGTNPESNNLDSEAPAEIPDPEFDERGGGNPS